MTELELIEDLRVNYQLYLGEKSLTALKFFVSGYRLCAIENGKEIPEDITKAMQEFVREWYGVSGHFPWVWILLMACGSEEAAFDEFFRLLHFNLQGYDPKTKTPRLNTRNPD